MTENKMSRRHFMPVAVLGTLGLHKASLSLSAPSPAEIPQRKYYTVLSLGRIGFKATFQQSVELAMKHGFEGLDPDLKYLSQLTQSDLQRVLEDLKDKNLRFGSAGLPVDFRKDELTFSDGLKNLPATAEALQRAGVRRVNTWIAPSSDKLTYLQNFRSHACRLRACAEILKDHGQVLGLEYVAPRTSWRASRHSFVHTLSEMKELIVAIGTNNLGVQLDSWHWFNAEETEEDLLTLRNRDVITVDLNDAPAGLPLDKQMDLSRELPAATGVIPVKHFLGALLKIGYDGPIQAEPFNATLRAMPIDQACAATAAAVKKAFGEAGVA